MLRVGEIAVVLLFALRTSSFMARMRIVRSWKALSQIAAVTGVASGDVAGLWERWCVPTGAMTLHPASPDSWF